MPYCQGRNLCRSVAIDNVSLDLLLGRKISLDPWLEGESLLIYSYWFSILSVIRWEISFDLFARENISWSVWEGTSFWSVVRRKISVDVWFEVKPLLICACWRSNSWSISRMKISFDLWPSSCFLMSMNVISSATRTAAHLVLFMF